MKTPAKIVSALFLCTALLASPAVRASEDVDPALKAKLMEQLKTEGYEVRKVQMEDGMIEAYAVRGSEKFELYFDKDLKPVKKAD